jgi:hypothetical protein
LFYASLVQSLQRENKVREFLSTVQFTEQSTKKPLLESIREFWTAGSPYVKECALVKKKPLSACYVKMNHDDVDGHLALFESFKNITMKELKAKHIRDFMTWEAERGAAKFAGCSGAILKTASLQFNIIGRL